MKKILGSVFLCVMLSCKNEKQVNSIEDKSWIYLEIGEREDLNDDALYGEISQKHLNWIKDDTKSEKLIMISKARYIDKKDSMVKDISLNSNEKGTFFYKIKDINYIEILKGDPINTKVDLIE
ncbi:MAG: hypothetical protein AAFX53_18930 [Bacteroidota bacterium]